MTTLLPDDDNQLIAELGAALRSAGPITDSDLNRGRASFTWRTVDDDLLLAALVYDSSIQERALVRDTVVPGGRMLIFEGATMSVEIDATVDALSGRVVPPGRADLSLMTGAGPAGETTADDMGCFVFAAPPPGPVRLHCRTATTRLVTDWIRL